MRQAYEKHPVIGVPGGEGAAAAGWQAVAERVSARAREILNNTGRCVVVVDCYPATDLEEVRAGLAPLRADRVILSDDSAKSKEALQQMLADTLTEDRVFGVMTTGKLADCFDPARLQAARADIAQQRDGLTLVYGVGAALLTAGDLLVVADLTRWEIQLRWRAGQPNWRADNAGAPILAKYKRGFFAEWRFADKHKLPLLGRMDFYLDTNLAGQPVIVNGDAFRQALSHTAGRPFRTVPYFDPGVWGGQWMKKVCGLDRSAPNYAWSFDGVPEENGLMFSFGGVVAQSPALNLVLTQPRRLLGERVYARFGAEFPIRFDLLDTMGGQNLSLQVHPLTQYIQQTFNMRYTQDESYYLLDAQEGGVVYLGLKNGVDPEEMMAALRRAQAGEEAFDAERFVNTYPVKKHDHFAIPAGTVHCSGENTMVLEVSATPYIFTFKLWDWGRLGLDGLPRPTHLDHGEKNIQWERDDDWVRANLLGQERLLRDEEGCRVEKTGLHATEFIGTYRYTLQKPCQVYTGDSVNVLNLVEGSAAVVRSPEGRFEEYVVHYAETFIVPASVHSYELAPLTPGETVKILLALVKPESDSLPGL